MTNLERDIISPLVDPSDTLDDDQHVGLRPMSDDQFDYAAAKRDGWSVGETVGTGGNFVLLHHEQVVKGPFPTEAEAWTWAPMEYRK